MDAEAERKAHKRQKLTDALQSITTASAPPPTPEQLTQSAYAQVEQLVNFVRHHSRRDLSSQERTNLRRAAHTLSEHAKKEERITILVEAGAIQALVPLLTLFAPRDTDACSTGASSAEEIEKEACYILSLLANKAEYQLSMAELGALNGLVAILKRYAPSVSGSRISNTGVSLIRRAADAITNMAHENVTIKTRVRTEDGITPLVTLLDAVDIKIQKAAASALRTLAFKNEQNKDKIVECGALPTLIHMLHAEDAGIHYEAVGVVGNLVHSSQHIKKSVLDYGALQPIIGLLSSKCQDAQREAALLIGQFATVDNAFKAKIVQRGAVPPLVEMLKIDDRQLREMAAFAIGRIAQNEDNQAGIVQAGGLIPLLNLIVSNESNLQHNAAFALYGLADNADNISAFVREGAVQILLACQACSQVQASRDCISKTLKRLEEKIQGSVMNQTLYLLQSTDRNIQQRSATALAMLLRNDLKKAFVDRQGLEILMRMVKEYPGITHIQKQAAAALHELANKARAIVPLECPPAPAQRIVMGPEFFNNYHQADVIFIVEGREFPAHKFCLQLASDAFRAMFDGGYLESDAKMIPIPNIPYAVFQAMMHCIYTGEVSVDPAMAEDLLTAADQYMLENLKRGCEEVLAQQICLDNLYQLYTISRDMHASFLGTQCVLYALQHYDDLSQAPNSAETFQPTLQEMVPMLVEIIREQLCKVS